MLKCYLSWVNKNYESTNKCMRSFYAFSSVVYISWRAHKSVCAMWNLSSSFSENQIIFLCGRKWYCMRTGDDSRFYENCIEFVCCAHGCGLVLLVVLVAATKYMKDINAIQFAFSRWVQAEVCIAACLESVTWSAAKHITKMLYVLFLSRSLFLFNHILSFGNGLQKSSTVKNTKW